MEMMVSGENKGLGEGSTPYPIAIEAPTSIYLFKKHIYVIPAWIFF
jgi:hypothetical protein